MRPDGSTSGRSSAAATKPFGFAAFQPGPGLGGHCIPIDPFYLTWKAREFDFSTRFIELAGEVHQNMPYYCRSRGVAGAEPRRAQVARRLAGLVLGVAYKADIADWRESPAVKLIELLQNAGANVAYRPRTCRRSRTTGSTSPRCRSSRPPTTSSWSYRTPRSTTRRSSRTRSSWSTCATRRAAPGHEREGLGTTRVAHAGVGGVGQNVVRVVGELAELAWICDTDAERSPSTRRDPNARTTASFDETLADGDVEAVVIATPVPTHHALARQALEAGKHVFVEKPPAMRGEMEELVALAEELASC